MKESLRLLIDQALAALRATGTLPADASVPYVVERTKSRDHGDFATNVAMLLAKPARSNPRALAQALVAALPQSPLLAKVEIAGPGFINLFLSPAAYHAEVRAAHAKGGAFGCTRPGRCTSATAEPPPSATASRACSRRTAPT